MEQYAEPPQRLVDETWDDGLRYTEERAAAKRSFPVRRCALWADDQEVPASTLDLLSLTLRFGAVAVPVEGYAGVSTAPEQRRRGYMERLFPRSMRSASERVSVACLYGIADFYPRFGFVTCLPETEYRVHLSDARRLQPVAEGALRVGSLADLPAMRALFNQVHGERPWSVARAAHWDAIPRSQEWRPGADIFLAESAGTLSGYLVIQENMFGWRHDRYLVHEIVAREPATARVLLADAARRARQLDYERIVFHEPTDSAVAVAAHAIGCEVVRRYSATGGPMAALLDRGRFLDALAPELARRAHAAGVAEAARPAARAALRSGTLIPDDGDLLRLVFGCERFDRVSDERRGAGPKLWETAAAWFPGGGTNILAEPFAYDLDEY